METPIEIRLPFENVEDLGLTLVHDIIGKPRNYLHEISVDRNHSTVLGQALIDAKYRYSHGYITKCGIKKDVFRKEFPLSVAEWISS